MPSTPSHPWLWIHFWSKRIHPQSACRPIRQRRHLKFSPGQSPTCNWMCFPMLLMTISTEKGELLAPLPCGRFFSILYLGHGARCQFLSLVLWGEHRMRYFHLHPPIPSDVFLFSWDYHQPPYYHRHSSLPKHITPTLFLSCLYITSLAQHLHLFPNRLRIHIPAILLSCWMLTFSLTPHPFLDFVIILLYNWTLVKCLFSLVVKRHNSLLDTWLFFLFLCLGPMEPSLAHPLFTDDNWIDSQYDMYGCGIKFSQDTVLLSHFMVVISFRIQSLT